MTKELYSLNDVSELLGVPSYRIVYLLSTRQVAEPKLRIGNRRLFTLPEIAAIGEKLKIDLGLQLAAGGKEDDVR